MAAGILKSRQTRYAAYAGTYILVIIAVLGPRTNRVALEELSG